MFLVGNVVLRCVAGVPVLDAEGLEAGDAFEAEEVVDFRCKGEGGVGGCGEGEAGGEADGVFEGLCAAVA